MFLGELRDQAGRPTQFGIDHHAAAQAHRRQYVGQHVHAPIVLLSGVSINYFGRAVIQFRAEPA
jgi:hypothetical protein